MTAVDFYELVKGFVDETDLSVWQRIIGALGSLDRLVEGDARAVFEAQVRQLLTPAVDRLGNEPGAADSDRDRQLRGVLFQALGVLGRNDPTVERARQLVAAATNGAAIDPSLLAAAVNVVASAGGAHDFDEFVSRFKSASTPQEQLRYLSALADFDDPALIERLLSMTVSDEIRTQDAPYVVRRAMTNRDHGRLAWEFVMSEWDTINERFPSNSIARMLEGIRSLSRPHEAQEIFPFFETHEVPQGDKILAQHLERLEVNVALRMREADHLAEHLV
jgi:puromycin-sensitive aminopeptidase